MREHGSLAEVVKFIRGKMADKAAEIAAAEAEESSEDEVIESDAESEEGGGIEMIINSDGEEEPAPTPKKASPKKKPAKPKKTKVSGGGMQIPEHWPWEEAKKLFVTPDVAKGEDLEVSHNYTLLFISPFFGACADAVPQVEWNKPDVEGLVEFLVREKGFKEDRVRAGAAKLTKMLAAKQQGRLDGFFTVRPKADDGKGKKDDGKGKGGAAKRKGDDKAKAGAKKKK